MSSVVLALLAALLLSSAAYSDLIFIPYSDNACVPLTAFPNISDTDLAVTQDSAACVPYTAVNNFSSQAPQWLLAYCPSAGNSALVNVVEYYYSINGGCPRAAVSSASANVSIFMSTSAPGCFSAQGVLNNGTSSAVSTFYGQLTASRAPIPPASPTRIQLSICWAQLEVC